MNVPLKHTFSEMEERASGRWQDWSRVSEEINPGVQT